MTKHWLWLREKDAEPTRWCPWEPPGIVVVGLTMMTDTPPGQDAGVFWLDDTGTPQIQLTDLGLTAYQEWQEA